MLIREKLVRDIPLITNSWLSNYRKGFHVKGVPNDVYFSWHHRVLEEILPRATTIVACDPEDPDTIYGWACAEVIDNQLVFHYVYVKQMVKAIRTGVDEQGNERRKGWGVGTALIQAFVEKEPDIVGVVYTHETMAGRCFMRRLYDKDLLPFEPVYNPYLLYSTMQPGWGSL